MFTFSNKFMWVKSFSFVIIITLVLSSFAWCQGASDSTKNNDAETKDLEVKITKLTGKSVQLSLGEGMAWKAAQAGAIIGRDASIRTGFASSCELNFGGHTIVQIQPLSSMRIADYSKTGDKEKVRANLQYGAVRCGVEKGRVKVDTRISTPVSTLSIRGTLVYVEYDRGTQRCLLRVDEDGPAIASAMGRCRCPEYKDNRDECDECPEGEKDPNAIDFGDGGGRYELAEGMRTDCSLGRYLRTAIFERNNWITGEVIATEVESSVYNDQAITPNEGALSFNDEKSKNSQSRTGCDDICFF